jgi:hypothetical protein
MGLYEFATPTRRFGEVGAGFSILRSRETDVDVDMSCFTAEPLRDSDYTPEAVIPSSAAGAEASRDAANLPTVIAHIRSTRAVQSRGYADT